MGTLLLLFIALPALELMLLIELGQRIGTLETVGVIVLTGVVGASMARNQGLRVLSYVQQQVAAGQMPTDALVDGIMILLASALLITPGILTDAFGFLCLIPGFRALVKTEVVRRFERAVAENRVHVHYSESVHRPRPGGMPFVNGPGDGPAPRGPIVDVTPERPPERDGDD
ncbi:MAG: FxsA family protein [Deltaproteobacteria bacterium]|nr:FxsA family protein [Deltaproteobacteria bacterium]